MRPDALKKHSFAIYSTHIVLSSTKRWLVLSQYCQRDPGERENCKNSAKFTEYVSAQQSPAEPFFNSMNILH